MKYIDALQGLLINPIQRAPNDQSFSFLSDDVARDLEDNWRYLNLCEPFDRGAVIAETGVSASFLDIAGNGSSSVAQFILDSVAADLAPTLPEQASFRTKITLKSLALRSKPLLSPYTGDLCASRDALGLEWYRLTTSDGGCFVSEKSEVSGWMGVDTLWVFPRSKIVLFASNGFGIAAIKRYTTDFILRILKNLEKVTSYLEDSTERKIGLVDWHCMHLCHNLWNLQSGWSNILEHRNGAEVDYVFERSYQNYYGNIGELFSDITQNIDKHFADDEDAVFEQIMSKNLLLFAVKDEYITSSLARRVLQHAYNSVSPAFLEEVKAFKAHARPLILTTIRLDNRSWIEQESGIINIMLNLKNDFPNIGLVIDGISINSLKGWTTDWMSVDAELEVANGVRNGLEGKVPLIFGVGRQFAESIVLCDQADFFLAPVGSGMTIYKWLSNVPGIAYSNKTVLDEEAYCWHLKVWDHYTDRVKPSVYIHSSKVVDSTEDVDQSLSEAVAERAARFADPTRANFHIEWRDIYDLAVSELRKELAKSEP